MELLPSCDPRLSISSASIYFGVYEALKTAEENAAQLAAENSLRQSSQKAVKDCRTASHDSVLQSQEDAVEPGLHEKSHIRPLSKKSSSLQSDITYLKQTTLISRKHRASVKDGGSSSLAAESVNEQPRTGAENIEHRSKRSVTKARTPRKRKWKDVEELTDHGDRFPSMSYLMNDEMVFFQHLSQLSLYAVLDRDPDDPMLLISLCELDDITAFQRQDFISDLNSAYIGRKPRFSCVRSPYSDRTFSRLGELSLQTYCDGRFIECGTVSRVHMSSLHRWASREHLEKVVCNTWSENQKIAVSLPYPPVRCLADIMCSWLSRQLCYLMSNMGIECIDTPDIFIGSSRQSELTTNCLYQMFCRYVDFLCEKSEKYFKETETYRNNDMVSARHRGKHAKLLNKKKDLSKRTTKQLSSRQMNAEYDYEDAYFEVDNSGLLEDADLEQVIPFYEMGRFSDEFAEKATGYGHRNGDAAATHRKRKLPEDHFDDEHWTSHDVPPKARRVHRDRRRLLAREKESDNDVYRKKHDRQRTRQKDADVAKSTRRYTATPSKHEDSPDFVLYDEDGTIVVQCSDNGRTAVVEDAKSGKKVREDKLKSAVDAVPASLCVIDDLCESNHQLYGVVHDHCYTTLSQSSEAPAVHDLDKDQHVTAVDATNSKDNNPALPITPLELTGAAENSDEKVPLKDHKLADGRKSKLSLDSAVESTAKKIRPVSSLAVVNTASVTEVTAKVKSPKQAEPKKPECHKMPVRPQQTAEKESAKVAQKNCDVSDTASVTKVTAKLKSPKRAEPKKPEYHKKLQRPHQTAEKESAMDAQKRCDVGKKKYSKVNKSETSDAAEVLHKEDSTLVSVSKDDGSSTQNKPFSALSETSEISTHDSKVSREKICVPLKNIEKVSDKVDKVPVSIIELDKASADMDKISEASSVCVDNDKNDKKVADTEAAVRSDTAVTDALPSAAALAAAARSASHYEDAYLSEMADAYGVWPLSNFDIAFDPTNVPGGHLYNPFRRTWPILQHVIDGKTDLLLKVCSFPDVSLFNIHRVMRENGFLWAVYLSLFDPVVSKTDSADSNLYSSLDLNAANKVKGAKSSNPLMQAFRQAVEAKKKVAAKSKLTTVRQNSDDASEVQAWSAKRPAGKMSIVFGSAVKSGGSLKSVVGADQSEKPEPPANKFSNLLTSAISKMNKDISDMISRKCGEQCLDKGDYTTKFQSSLPVESKHLSALSDLAVDMYDIAEYKLEKICAAKDAEKVKSGKDNESVAVSETSAVVITTAAAAASSPASDVISLSSALLPLVSASKPTTAVVTPLSGSLSADVKLASVAGQVSQSSTSQPVAAQSAASTAVSVATAGNDVHTSTSTDTVTSYSAAVSAAAPVTVKVTASTVADMPPPPMPPLSLSCIGIGFDLHVTTVTTSSSSGVLTAWPSSSSANSASTNALTCTAAYQAAVGSFAYPPSVSTVPPPPVPAAFSSPSLPRQLIHVPPPPSIQPNLYSLPPPVGIPLNVPPPAFLDTSVPPPVASYPPTSWYLPPTSAAGGYPGPGGTYSAVPVSGYQEMSESPNTAVSCDSATGKLQTTNGKVTTGSPAVENLQTAAVGVTSRSGRTIVPPVTSVVSQLNTEQQNASSVTLHSPFAHRPGVLTTQRPHTNVEASNSTASAPNLLPGSQSHPAYSQGMPQKSLVSPAGFKLGSSFLIQGKRPRGPLKPVIPISQLPPSRLPGPVVRHFAQVSSTASTEIRSTSPLQSSNIQLRGTVSGVMPSPSEAAHFPVINQDIHVLLRPVTSQPDHVSTNNSSQPRGTLPDSQPRVPIRPVSTQPNDQPRATGPVVGQSPRDAVRPRPPMNQSAQPGGALPDSQPGVTVRPVSTQPKQADGQPRATGPLPGQNPYSTVRPRPAMNQSAQPRGTLPGSQPRGTIRPVSARPIHPDNQPRAVGPPMIQSPCSAVQPQTRDLATSVNQTSQSVQLASGTPTVCTESRLPSGPAQPAGAAALRTPRPLTAAGGASGVQPGKGPLLTANSRVYVLNSDSSPLCKDVEVSLKCAGLVYCQYFCVMN